MEQQPVSLQTLELVYARKPADRLDTNSQTGAGGTPQRPARRGRPGRIFRRSAAILLSAIMLGLPGMPNTADFWGSREVSSFLVARTTPLSGASFWDVLARSVASSLWTERMADPAFDLPASDGSATLFGAYLAYDHFPDQAANPIPPESDLSRHNLPALPAGEDAIAHTIRPNSTAGYEYAKGIFVQNGTGTATDPAKLLAARLSFTLKDKTGPQVLVIHTHTSEAYAPDPFGEDNRQSDDRTDDPAQSVVRVGKEIADTLNALGIPTMHDTTVYDETYTGAYARSLAGVEKLLLRYPSIRVVLDVHRDALNDPGERRYKLVFPHEGEQAAQVMFVVGTDKGSLPHANWQGNYALALKVQADMLGISEVFPRPIKLTRSSYHQHVAPGALLLEVGSNGNAVSEAVRAGKLFAESLARVLKKEAG